MINIANGAAIVKATDVTPTTADPFLAEKAAAIHRVVDRMRKRTRDDVIEIGGHLAEVRAHVGEGNWLGWLEAEFGWSDQTARRCIHEFEAYRRDPALNIMLTDNLPMTAVYLLVAPNTPPEVSEEIAERIESGEKMNTADVKETIRRAKKPKMPSDDDNAGHDGDDANADGDDAGHDGDAGHEDEDDLTLWVFFSTASGTDIYEEIPADRRNEVCRAFLDQLTVAGMLEAMSDEFGRQLRARLPAPKRNDDAGPHSPGENDRLRARVEELNTEKQRLRIKIGGLESEVEHLNEQLRHAVEPGLGEPAKTEQLDPSEPPTLTHPDADLDVRTYAGGMLFRGQS